jgi:hypothetical protein
MECSRHGSAEIRIPQYAVSESGTAVPSHCFFMVTSVSVRRLIDSVLHLKGCVFLDVTT